MTDFSEYADQLQQEVVAEIAESYFGERKNLDDMIEDFEVMIGELRQVGLRVGRAATRLDRLLLDRASVNAFFIALEVDPVCVPFALEPCSPFFDTLPLALTGAGRYAAFVYNHYVRLQEAAESYLHGEYFKEEGRNGRKRLTVSYIRLREFANRIDGEVIRVNRNRAPTGTLRYVKDMDPVQMEQERVMGDVSFVDGGTLDADLRFSPVAFADRGLPVVQELPAASTVKGVIRAFAKELFRNRPQEARLAMKSLVSREVDADGLN
jgi:hypothetical protein